MALKGFVRDLTRSLAETGLFSVVTMETDGPTVRGKAFVTGEVFLRFFFNEATGMTAFALIEGERGTWGIDYDNRRGWHLHPEADPTGHRSIQPMSVDKIVANVRSVLDKRGVP